MRCCVCYVNSRIFVLLFQKIALLLLDVMVFCDVLLGYDVRFALLCLVVTLVRCGVWLMYQCVLLRLAVM